MSNMKDNNSSPYKLDLKDWKILNELDLDSRQSDSQIAKKVRLSKQVVNYRIKKLIDEKIITSFVPHINIAKLGYRVYKVYLQFKSLTKNEEENMWNYLVKQLNIVWVISCSGRWHLVFAIVAKEIEDFDKILTDFMDKYSKHISERTISVFNKATLRHRNWLLKEKIKKLPIGWLVGGKTEDNKLDETDKKILKILNEDAKIPIINIASKTKISSSLVIQRIKKLKDRGIIGAFKTGLNIEKLGMNYCKAFIYYQNKTSEKEQELLENVYFLPGILGVSQSIGPWDLEMEFEVKNYNDFHKIIKKLKNEFPLIANFETSYIEKEYGLSYLPGDL